MNSEQSRRDDSSTTDLELGDAAYLARFVRQERFSPLGTEGGQRLRQSKALVCGCGALGSMIAERLARAGVGTIRLVDRDWVELSNLPRQTLFTEADAVQGRPKAIAAADALAAIDSRLNIEPFVADVTCDNICELAAGCDVIVDGTDNFETRFLLNDYSLKYNVPWVHGGCLGASGQVMTIVPGKTACFRCLVRDMPSRDSVETCDSAGVLGPAVGIIACWQAAEALKILAGKSEAVCQDLLVIDSWNTSCRTVSLASLRSKRICPACQQGEFPFLDGRLRTEAVVLCGKNAVQINTVSLGSDFPTLAEKLRYSGTVKNNGFFIRLGLNEHTLTIFKDGRVVVEGTTEPAVARNILAKTLGG
jgi:molybdopterin-synthase adenylyltransferase